MNKNIKLAVAGAVLALSASANAGIVIPAGDWTLDVNGNVNAFASWHKADHSATVTGGLATKKDTLSEDAGQNINTGLLPTWLGFTGTTRQNDTDVTFNISMQPGVSDNGATGDFGTTAFRTSYVSFGDKSWGSIKLGKDLGIFASDAILSDMTLLGVGGGLASQSGANTTLVVSVLVTSTLHGRVKWHTQHLTSMVSKRQLVSQTLTKAIQLVQVA